MRTALFVAARADLAMAYRAFLVAFQLEGHMRDSTELQQGDLFETLDIDSVSMPQRVRLELTQLLCALLIELTQPTCAPSGAHNNTEEARPA
jgi:hypothetical protein